MHNSTRFLAIYVLVAITSSAAGVLHESAPVRRQSQIDKHSVLAQDMIEEQQGNKRVWLTIEDANKILVGFHTSSVPKYTARLESQFQTWAADVPPKNILVTGGKYDNVGAASFCNDYSQTCKEAAVFFAAANRLAEVDAEWFVGVHEDAYIRWAQLVKALPTFNRPVVMAGVGCGQGWKYHKDSKNGTLPRPKDWVESVFACQDVFEHGGLCTGPAYFMNRAALLALTKGHRKLETFYEHYVSYWQGPKEALNIASDRLMGCVFRAKGIDMISLWEGARAANWYNAEDIAEGWEKRHEIPNMIREDHAILLNIDGVRDGTPIQKDKSRMRIPLFMHEVHNFITRGGS